MTNGAVSLPANLERTQVHHEIGGVGSNFVTDDTVSRDPYRVPLDGLSIPTTSRRVLM